MQGTENVVSEFFGPFTRHEELPCIKTHNAEFQSSSAAAAVRKELSSRLQSATQPLRKYLFYFI
jgi:hypothetical protein